MKEPKYQKLEYNQNQNKKYSFFQEEILREKEDIKNVKNKTPKKDGKKPPFNLSAELEQKKPPNTQNDDDVLSFFTKDYPSSNEEKEEIVLIKTPTPSETSDIDGEVEEVEGIEEEENQNSKNGDITNVDLGQIDFNSKLEEELEEERKKKDKKNKELEKKKQEEEKKLVMDKKKKEEEEERKKILKSGKNNNFLLSNIQKYKGYSNIAPTSMPNEIKPSFPGAIKKEDTKKSKSKKVSKQEKPKKQKNSTKISQSEKEEEKERNKIKKNKKNKKNGLGITEKPKKSTKNESKKRNFEYNDENEEFSDYGDELQSSSSDVPKKEKIKAKDTKFPKLPKKLVRDRYYSDNQELLRIYHEQENLKLFTYDIKPENKNKGFGINGRYSLRTRIPPLRKEFGESAHYVYSKNCPELRNVEKVSNPYAGFAYISNIAKGQTEEKRKKRKKKKKKLVNRRIILQEKTSDNILEGKDKNDKEESKDAYNSDKLDSQGYSEYVEDEERFLKIPKHGKKNASKNYDTSITIKVHMANGKNMIKVDKIIYKDVKGGDTIRVNKNQVYEIFNFSDNDLIVQLLLDEEDN